MSDSVGQYLNEIGLVPLLTAAEERELSQIIEKGVEARERLAAGEKGVELKRADRKAAEAKDRFIRANLRLVVSVARRYPLPAGMELLDLIQEGNLGLEHAVDKFDWRKGFKFSTYATFWIRQAIGRALDQKASLVRLPGDRSASLRAALRQVSGDGDELDEEHARLHRLTTPTSLDRTIGDDDSNELVDLLPDVNPGPEQAVMEEAREAEITNSDEIVFHRPPPKGISVSREGNIFTVKGRQAERAVALNDLTNIEALEYIQVTLERIGVNKALRRAGIRQGDYVQIGELQFDYMDDDEHWID